MSIAAELWQWISAPLEELKRDFTAEPESHGKPGGMNSSGNSECKTPASTRLPSRSFPSLMR